MSEFEYITSEVPEWFNQAMAVSSIDHRLAVRDCPIHAISWGNPTKPLLLFLHGRMQHAHCWGFVAPLLAESYHCVAMSFSGMGDSGRRDHYAYEDRIAEVVGVATEMGSAASEKPIIVSHSYGAVVAEKTILAHPYLFQGLIACDPSLKPSHEWPNLSARTDGFGLQRPQKTRPRLADMLQRFALAPEQSARYPGLVEYIAFHSLCEVADGWQWKFDPWVYSEHEEGHVDWWVEHTQEFLSVKLPKALIYGANSEMINAETVAELRKLDRNIFADYCLADAHHHLMVDRPTELKESIETAVQIILAR